MENPLLMAPQPFNVAAAEIVDPAALRQAIQRERKIRIAYADEQGTATDRIIGLVALDERYPKTRQALIRAWSAHDAGRARHRGPADKI